MHHAVSRQAQGYAPSNECQDSNDLNIRLGNQAYETETGQLNTHERGSPKHVTTHATSCNTEDTKSGLAASYQTKTETESK